jgi:hypothetical protein
LRRALVAFAIVAVVAVVAFLAVADTKKHELAFTLGVVGDRVAVKIDPRHTACQTPIAGSAAFDAVELSFGTYGLPGPPLLVSARDSTSGHLLATGRLRGGYPDNRGQTVELDREVPERLFSLCVGNVGTSPVALYGNAPQAAYGSTIQLDGRDVGFDAQMVFDREKPASLLALTPEIFRRASLFNASWVGPWTFWALAVGVFLVLPLLLALTLRAACESLRAP